MDVIHYSKQLSFPIRLDDEPTICGLKLDSKLTVTNNPFIITCPKCIEELEKRTCSICGVRLNKNSATFSGLFAKIKTVLSIKLDRSNKLKARVNVLLLKIDNQEKMIKSQNETINTQRIESNTLRKNNDLLLIQIAKATSALKIIAEQNKYL